MCMMRAYNLFFHGESESLYEVRLGVFLLLPVCSLCSLLSNFY